MPQSNNVVRNTDSCDKAKIAIEARHSTSTRRPVIDVLFIAFWNTGPTAYSSNDSNICNQHKERNFFVNRGEKTFKTQKSYGLTKANTASVSSN